MADANRPSRPIEIYDLERLLIALFFLAAAALLALSLNLPALQVDRFWIFSRDISLLAGIQSLIDGGQAVLGWGVLALSVGLPAAKIAIGLLITVFARHSGPFIRLVVRIFENLGKWSLADVFVVAIIVMVIDGQVLTSANIGIGVYLFASAIILSFIATIWLGSAVDRTQKENLRRVQNERLHQT